MIFIQLIWMLIYDFYTPINTVWIETYLNHSRDTSCRLIRLVIILVINKSGPPCADLQFCTITRMITDRIGFHSATFVSLDESPFDLNN